MHWYAPTKHWYVPKKHQCYCVTYCHSASETEQKKLRDGSDNHLNLTRQRYPGCLSAVIFLILNARSASKIRRFEISKCFRQQCSHLKRHKLPPEQSLQFAEVFDKIGLSESPIFLLLKQCWICYQDSMLRQSRPSRRSGAQLTRGGLPRH